MSVPPTADRALRVLVVHRYYWPDTPPYASLLREIVARWSAEGHEVDVLSSQPSYKPEADNARRPSVERVDASTVHRISMKPDRTGRLRRVFNVMWFPLAVAWWILRSKRYDVVMCSTAPPVLLGAVVSWSARRRGSAFVYHCMDLHPEIGALSEDFSNALVYRGLMRLEVATCRRASAIVVLSEDMRLAVERRDPGLAGRIKILNNFDLPSYEEEAASPLPPNPAKIRVVFTGNLGRFQGLENITQAVLCDDPGLAAFELVFMGEGAAKEQLQSLVAAAPDKLRARVHFLPHGSVSEARALLGTADLGLVSLAPGVVSYAYPSKTATYLAEGLPVLVAVESDSQLARTVVAEGIGVHLPADVPGAAQSLAAIAADRTKLKAMRERALSVWKRDFSAAELLPSWSALLGELRGEAGSQ